MRRLHLGTRLSHGSEMVLYLPFRLAAGLDEEVGIGFEACDFVVAPKHGVFHRGVRTGIHGQAIRGVRKPETVILPLFGTLEVTHEYGLRSLEKRIPLSVSATLSYSSRQCP